MRPCPQVIMSGLRIFQRKNFINDRRDLLLVSSED